MLVLTPQGIDCCTPKLMSFLLLSTASGVSSYLTLSVFSTHYCYSTFPHLRTSGWSAWAVHILPCFCLLIGLSLFSIKRHAACFRLSLWSAAWIQWGVTGERRQYKSNRVFFIVCESNCHNYHKFDRCVSVVLAQRRQAKNCEDILCIICPPKSYRWVCCTF